ncbi:terminal uridylyltransferase 4 [Nephila pilipes]|uniref:Terminal uridylyltransferase 4 n=1 Tax=Nephila pilipes TaxID=299642 RepID=A0A8X6PZ75_NEPPI|nr:terminal uridylyltransferase 4 [Nephila pilipes]
MTSTCMCDPEHISHHIDEIQKRERPRIKKSIIFTQCIDGILKDAKNKNDSMFQPLISTPNGHISNSHGNVNESSPNQCIIQYNETSKTNVINMEKPHPKVVTTKRRKEDRPVYRVKRGFYNKHCESKQLNQQPSLEEDSKPDSKNGSNSIPVVHSEECKSHEKFSDSNDCSTSDKISSHWDNFENGLEVKTVTLKNNSKKWELPPLSDTSQNNHDDVENNLCKVTVAKHNLEFPETDKNLGFMNNGIKQDLPLFSAFNNDPISNNDLKNNLPEISFLQENLESPSTCLIHPNDNYSNLFEVTSTLDDSNINYIPPPQPPPGSNTVKYSSEVTDERELNSLTIPYLPTQSIAYESVSSKKMELKDALDIEIADHIPDCKQIEEISKFLTNLESEKSMASDIADRIANDVNKVLIYRMKGNRVHVYGSYRIGTAVTTSNLNLALETDQPVKNNFLLHLQKMLSKDLIGYYVYPFEGEQNARRSKVCLSQNQLGVYCEIIYLGETVSQHLKMSNILRSVCKYDQRVQTLCIATRRWAEICEIQDPENGMMHPIGFTLLVIHFLQQMEKPLLPLINVSSKDWGLCQFPIRNNASVGELWLNFLKYYSCTFNWNENVVSVTDERTIRKSTKFWDVSWIAVEDPISGKNVADSVITSDKADTIIANFKSTYEYFLTPLNDSDSNGSESSEIGSQISGKYSFSYCVMNPPPVFCSDCDDDSECENCYEPQQIALEPLTKISESSMKCVNDVLWEAYNEFKIPDCKVDERKVFVKKLEGELKKLYPDVKLTLFGSSVNGFGFQNSDLDICMTFKAKEKKDINVLPVLKNVLRQLRRNKCYKNAVPLYAATIPIIKFHYIAKEWNCDLSFYNVLAVHNSTLLRKYSLMDERCRILGCCLKLLAKKANIADGASRKLSSYSYILMTIHYLQQLNPPVLPIMPVCDKEALEKRIEILNRYNYWHFENVAELKHRYRLSEQNTQSIGELWLGLLEYYLKFSNDKAVTITENEPVLTSTLMKSARFINIEDPLLPKKNLGCIVSESNANASRRVLHRARMLFGKDCPYENKTYLQSYYFSPSNLTGQFVKDVECFSCGCFGHEKKDCAKTNPFKRKQFIYRNPKTYIKTKWDS